MFLSYLSGNQLGGSIPASLGSLSTLINLCVPPRATRGYSEPYVEAPACCSCVRCSCADNNQLNGTIPTILGNLTTLTQLCVRRFEVCGVCFVCCTEARPCVAPLLCDVTAARSTTTNSAAPFQPA